MANTKVKLLHDTVTIPTGSIATTQSASDNTTKVATTAYVTTALANLADSAPSTLNTLNELAAALGDDANFSTTVTNSIATKLPLAGGTMTGDLLVKPSASGATATSNTVGTFESNDNTEVSILGGSSSVLALNFGHSGDNDDANINYNTTSGSEQMAFRVNASDKLTIKGSGDVLIGQTSSVTNGKLQVTGGIGLTGNSTIRSSTNSDNGDTIKFFGTQFVAGTNSHSYSYSGGGQIASLAVAGSAILLDVGNTTANTGHRFKVISAANGVDGSLQYIDGTTTRFHVDSSTGIIKENNIPVRSRAIAMAMVFG